MVDHACSLCTQEAEARGLQCSPGQHELQNETLSEKPTNPAITTPHTHTWKKKSKFSKKNVGEVAK